MTKTEFLRGLSDSLTPLSDGERGRWLAYYGELIDDAIEEGADVAEAVAAFGNPKVVAASIFDEAEAPLLDVGEPADDARRRSGMLSVCYWLLSPFWTCGLLVVLTLALTIWVVVLTLLLAFWALMIGCVAFIPWCLGLAVYLAILGNGPGALFDLGSLGIMMGLSILLVLACPHVWRGFKRFSHAIAQRAVALWLRAMAVPKPHVREASHA